MQQAVAKSPDSYIFHHRACPDAPDTRFLTAKSLTMKTRFLASALLLAACALGSSSCDRKEKVLDVDTPGGGIQIEKDKKSGEVDIKIEDKK
jgi:hypothetical protein